MSTESSGSRRWWPDWRALCLIGLAALCLMPAIKTGYWAEDIILSLVPGELRYSGQSIASKTVAVMKANLSQGRFYPITPVLQTVVFDLTRNVVAYKAYLVAGVVLDVLLFYLLIRRLGGNRRFACLAACLTIGLFQIRIYPDPILAYYGQMQFVTAGLFVSMLALQRFLDDRKRGWLALGAISYLLISLTYEISYPFVLLHLLLVVWARPGWWAGLKAAAPFVAVVGACGAMTLLMRTMYADENYYIHDVSSDPVAFVSAMGRQISAALPLSYFLADPQWTFREVRDVPTLLGWVARPAVGIVALSAMVMTFFSLRRPDAGTEQEPSGRWPLIAGVGLMLAVLPAVLISMSPFHRRTFSIGVGWIPVLIQYHGVGLLLAALIWRLSARRWLGGPFARWKCLAASTIVAGLLGVSYRANVATALRVSAPPGSPHYSEMAAMHLSVWHDHRVNLASALRAGLLEDVPERSPILLANTYPAWQSDPVHTAYFYAMHTAKVFDTRPPAFHGADLPDAGVFRLRDVCLGPRTGFVVLSEVKPDDGDPDREVRLFVRSPHLFRDGTNPAFLLVGDRASSSSADHTPSPSYLRLGRTLSLIHSGRDWGIFSLGDDPGESAVSVSGSVEPDSLRLVFDPVTAAAMLRSAGADAVATEASGSVSR